MRRETIKSTKVAEEREVIDPSGFQKGATF